MRASFLKLELVSKRFRNREQYIESEKEREKEEERKTFRLRGRNT
jgi:hypothetical protein